MARSSDYDKIHVVDGFEIPMKEVRRIKMEKRDGAFYDSVWYQAENYGSVEYVEGFTVHNEDFRRARAMLPFMYMDATPKKFDWEYDGADTSKAKFYANKFVTSFEMFQKSGKGLYIHSSTRGSGKTMLACCLANGIMERQNLSVKFISTPEFLELTKKKANSVADFENLEFLKNAKLLIIDDIGVELKRDWVDAELFRLIDWRYVRKLTTIFTSNVPIEQLQLDSRIVDRIYSMSIPLKLPEVSVRKIQTDSEKQDFINKL